MSDEIVLYTQPQSRGRIARWMLEEVGVPYRAELVTLGAAAKSPALLAVNRMGKVPTLVHKGVVVSECAAICAYLADAFPEAALAPPLNQRGAYYRWLFFAAGPLEAASTNHALGFVTPETREVMAGYGRLETVVDTLESAVSRTDYVAGAAFGAADIYVGSQIGWGLQFGWLERRPAFERYWERISERPAAVRARDIDDALSAPAPGTA
jgi:glutathione S-transferase